MTTLLESVPHPTFQVVSQRSRTFSNTLRQCAFINSIPLLVPEGRPVATQIPPVSVMLIGFQTSKDNGTIHTFGKIDTQILVAVIDLIKT
jgi:hypothetical protein